MPYTIDWEARGVYKKYSEQVNGQEFLEAVCKVNASPDFENFRYVINDFSDCQEFDLSGDCSDDAVAAAIGAHSFNRRFAAAFVASNQAVAQRLQSMLRIAQPYLRVALFADLPAARQWIASHDRA